MSSLRLPTSFAVIFGSFTLGLYVAIQGPTLMDLIDILHINNDIMSWSLAFASLAYSVGGLLSGFLFNYVNRQVLIAVYFIIFGVSNIITPFITNYMLFSVITAFKMMCAGGTDCGANVWILEMWPGQDAWLQALHFLFAVGCAIGPLVVEPFLSVEYKENELDKIAGKTSGATTINDQNNETRIHIPYGASGLASIFAAVFILILYHLEQSRKRQALKLRTKQQLAAGEHILLTNVKHPAQLEAGGGCLAIEEERELEEELQEKNDEKEKQREEKDNVMVTQGVEFGHKESSAAVVVAAAAAASNLALATNSPGKRADGNAFTECAVFIPANQQQASEPPTVAVQISSNKRKSLDSQTESTPIANNVSQQQQQPPAVVDGQAQINVSTPLLQTQLPQAPTQPQLPPTGGGGVVKITSKAREQSEGRPPYYVMVAIALAAMCLSFYCGIEITSMNYLATFAVNLDLQLPKSTAAYMSSALTISFAVGRGFGIWIAAYMKPHKLFYLCAGVMATGNVFMLIFANTAETFLWYSICLFGIGCGPMFPAIVSFYDDRISKVTNTVSGIFILGSMFNVALNSLIIGHHIIDNALILIVCNLVGSILLLLLFGTLHMLTKVKKNQRVKKFRLRQQSGVTTTINTNTTTTTTTTGTAPATTIPAVLDAQKSTTQPISASMAPPQVDAGA